MSRAAYIPPVELPRELRAGESFCGAGATNKKDNNMNPASEKLAAAAALFAFLVLATPAARADDYCITNGAQAAHGCGYPSMEMCRAASAGIGGTCALSASSRSASDAMAYQPAQPQSRGKRKAPTRH